MITLLRFRYANATKAKATVIANKIPNIPPPEIFPVLPDVSISIS